MASKSEKSTYQYILTPRMALGWPCFFCGKPKKKCPRSKHGATSVRAVRKTPACCRRCKGRSNH